jgi:hypothetical protein
VAVMVIEVLAALKALGEAMVEIMGRWHWHGL